MKSIEFIKSIPEFMIGWSYNLWKRNILNRKYKDFDIIVPSSYWGTFKELEIFPESEANPYEHLLPKHIFIYSIEFTDYKVDLIFRKDYTGLKYENIDWYKYCSVEEIKIQKEYLISNWGWRSESKHIEDINKIDIYIKNNLTK